MSKLKRGRSANEMVYHLQMCTHYGEMQRGRSAEVTEMKGMVDDEPRKCNPRETHEQTPLPSTLQPTAQAEHNPSANQQETARHMRVRAIAKRRRSERRKRTLKFWIELVAALATVAIAALTYAYVHYSSKQWQTMRQELEISERPWISVAPVQFSGLTFDNNGGRFTIRLLIKNTGHSPATHVQLQAKLIPIKFGQEVFSEPVKEQRRLCNSASTRKGREEFAAFTLFPDEQTTRDAGMSMTPDEIKSAETKPPKWDKPFIVVLVAGCVDYQFEFERGHHQTGFLYQLWRIDPKDPFNGAATYSGESLPSSSLRLEPYPFGGSYPD